MAMRLKWKEYDYTGQLGPGNSLIFRPLIAVTISVLGGREEIRTMAMIDSGTDGSVFNADLARTIGIDLNACQRVRLGGIGTTEGYASQIRLFVPDFDAIMDIPVVFAENPPFDGLLGQRHFFQRFFVRFEKSRNKFFLALS